MIKSMIAKLIIGLLAAFSNTGEDRPASEKICSCEGGCRYGYVRLPPIKLLHKLKATEKVEALGLGVRVIPILHETTMLDCVVGWSILENEIPKNMCDGYAPKNAKIALLVSAEPTGG